MYVCIYTYCIHTYMNMYRYVFIHTYICIYTNINICILTFYSVYTIYTLTEIDNVLLEIMLALELYERGYIQKIFPLFLGKYELIYTLEEFQSFPDIYLQIYICICEYKYIYICICIYICISEKDLKTDTYAKYTFDDPRYI
jgi:hypothetical protein